MSNNNIETSILAADVTVEGEVEFVGTLIVEGKLDGNIKGDDMIIQRSGSVTGTINVNSINSHGKTEGDINSKEFIAHGTSITDGTINTESLEVETGAQINGKLNMTKSAPPLLKRAPKPPAAAPAEADAPQSKVA